MRTRKRTSKHLWCRRLSPPPPWHSTAVATASPLDDDCPYPPVSDPRPQLLHQQRWTPDHALFSRRVFLHAPDFARGGQLQWKRRGNNRRRFVQVLRHFSQCGALRDPVPLQTRDATEAQYRHMAVLYRPIWGEAKAFGRQNNARKALLCPRHRPRTHAQ